MTPNLRDSSFNNHDLIESGATFKDYADYLIAHASLGLRRELGGPLLRKPDHRCDPSPKMDSTL